MNKIQHIKNLKIFSLILNKLHDEEEISEEELKQFDEALNNEYEEVMEK
jgi:hypothetical protein